MILCCGEALIDMIPHPTEIGEPGLVPHCGGAALNTAIALGRLDIPVGLFSGLSNDLFGKRLFAALDAANVDHSLVVRSDRPVTLAFVQLTDGKASYHFYDENTAGRMISPDDLPKLPEQVDTLLFGGISLGAAPAADSYLALAEHEAGRRVIMLDPNIRPAFIADEMRYRARLKRMIAVADIIKISDDDLEWLVPGDIGIEAKAAGLLSHGASLVLLTAGAEGSTGFTAAGERIRVPARAFDVVDTVGAGDTFNAGVLGYLHEHGLLSRETIARIDGGSVCAALEFGARAAAISVSRAGANPPWRNEL